MVSSIPRLTSNLLPALRGRAPSLELHQESAGGAWTHHWVRGNELPGTGLSHIPRRIKHVGGQEGPVHLSHMLGVLPGKRSFGTKEWGGSKQAETIDAHYTCYIGFTHSPFYFHFCMQSY